MSEDDRQAGKRAQAEARKRSLPPAARRALEEAAARRQALDKKQESAPKELGGRKGPDPARYGDWEVKGIASDF